MKASRIMTFIILFILFVEFNNSQKVSKNINTITSFHLEIKSKGSPNDSNINPKSNSNKLRSLQFENTASIEKPGTQGNPHISNILNFQDITDFSDFEKLFKPSKAFTAILMVYMVLIIAGAILVLVLIKPKIEN